VFVVASARDGFDPAAVLFEFDGVRRDTAPSREARQVAPTIPSRSTAGGGLGTDFDCDGGVITMAHGQGGAEIGFDRGPTLTCNHEAPTVARSLLDGGHTNNPLDETLVPVGVTIHGTDPTVQKVASYDDLAQCLRARTPGNIDNSSTTVVQQPVAHEDTMPTMTAGGPSASSHNQTSGQMRDRYIVPVTVGAMSASGGTERKHGHGWGQQDWEQGYAIPVAFDTTQMTSKANRSNPQPGDPCHPLAAGAHAPAIAFTQGELHGWMDGRTPQSSNDLPTGTVRGVRRCGCGGAPQERGLEGSQAGEPAAPLQELPHEGAQVGCEVPAVRETAQGIGLLRDALPEAEAPRRPGIQADAICLQCGGVRVVEPFDGPVRQACAAGQAGDAGQAADEQERGGTHPMAVRRLTPVECERLQGFPDNWTLIPWRKKPASECPDGPRYKALGNSWAVPVVAWIGRRIDAHLRALDAANDNHPQEGRAVA
jgi:DNA (cytosine-5)-methyltransferase 1